MPRVIALPDNMSMAEAKGELIPEGDYWDVLIEKVDETQTKKDKDDMYVLTLRILDPGPAQNRSIRSWVVLKAPGYTLKQLNTSIGMPTTTDEDGGGLYAGDPNEYLGQTTHIRIKHAEYPEGSGEQSASVDRYLVVKSGTKAEPKKASGRVALPRRGAPAKPDLAAVPDQPESTDES